MASSHGNEPPDVSSLLKSLSKTEITLISDLLRKKASKQLQDGVSEVGKAIESLVNYRSGMTECDILYWYCNIKLLSSALQSAEQKALGRLKLFKKSFDCTTCKNKIELNYRKGLLSSLEKHVCNTSKSQGTRSSDQNNPKLLQEYELHKILNYENKIKDKLFFKVPDYKFYLYTIYVIDDKMLCLTCNCEISGKLNVMQHVSGSRHITGLEQNYANVLAFHRYFRKLKEGYQFLQRNFRIYDNTSVQCMLCRHIMLLENVKQHIEGPCFEINEDGQCIIPVKYDAHIKATIYKDLLEYCVVVDDVNCPTLQNIENGIYCLLCNANVTKHIYIHIDSSVHQSNLDNTSNLQNLKKYHQVWTALPVHIQVEQPYFRRREQKITCTLCSTFFRYNVDDLVNHVNSMNHKMFLMKTRTIDDPSTSFQKQSSQSASSRSASVETDRTTSLSTSSSSSNSVYKPDSNSATTRDLTPPLSNSLNYRIPASLGIAKIPYDKSVLEELYPDGLMLFTITMDTVKYPIIIKRETCKHCFICNTDVSTPVLLHVNSPEHIVQMGCDRRRELLKKFHDLWISLPQSDQCRQIAFKIEDDLVCMLCDKMMGYDIGELKRHVESWEHVQKVMAKHANGAVDDIKEVPNISQTLSNGMVSNSPAKTTSTTRMDNPADVLNEKPKSLQDLLSSIKISNNPEINKSSEKKVENSLTKSGAVTYSKEILNDLYGDDLIHYYIRINDVRYPFIQNMGTHKRCLICNIDLISSVLFHINSSPHIQSSSDSEKIKQLRKYHDLWLNFSESDQREQKYFDIGEKLKCSLCQKELEYDAEALTAHIFSTGHGNETWSLHHESSTVSGKLIDERNLTEMDTSSDEEVTLEHGKEQTPDSGKSNETLLMPDVSSDFLGPQINATKFVIYYKSTMQSVYNNLHQYVVVIEKKRYLFVQNRYESKYCLICGVTITDVDEHISSVQHSRNELDNGVLKSVKAYHTLFMSLKKEFHMEQIDFKPTANGVTCIVCDLYLSKRLSLRDHIQSSTHVQRVKEKRPITICKNKSEPKVRTKEQCRMALQALKLNLDLYTVQVQNIKYYYIQNRENYQYCMLCQMVLSDVNAHVGTFQHATNSRDAAVLQSLRKFYQLFSTVVLRLQIEQIHFAPDKDGVKCLKCDFVCSAREFLKEHLNSKTHEQNQRTPEHKAVQAEVLESVATSNVIRQEACSTAKNNLLEYIIIIQGLGYFFIQNRHDGLYCLICRLAIKNVTEHVKCADHITNEQENTIRNSVKKYHELFLPLNRKSRRQQIYFRPETNGVSCLKCDVFCASTVEIVDHLESFSHTLFLSNTKPNSNVLHKDDAIKQEEYSTECTDLYEYFINIQGVRYFFIQIRPDSFYCLMCRAAIQKIVDHVKDVKHLSSQQNDYVLNSIKIYQDLFAPLKHEFRKQQIYFDPHNRGVKCLKCEVLCTTTAAIQEHLQSDSHIELIGPTFKTDVFYEDNAKKHGRDSPPNLYSNETLDVVYPNLTQYSIDVDNVIYPCIQKRPHGLFCLICQTALYAPIETHITNESHIKRYQDPVFKKMVSNYHQAFAELSSKQQVQQTDFELYVDKMICIPCGITCPLTSTYIKRHLESVQHYENVMSIGTILEKSKNHRLSKKESARVCNFILHSLNTNLRQYAVKIKRSIYYYLQNRRKYKYCLICQMTIEDVDVHVESSQHQSKRNDNEALELVRNYYILFQTVPLEMRIEQVHFAPEAGGVKCLLCEKFCSSVPELKRHLESRTHQVTRNSRRSEYSVVQTEILNISGPGVRSSDDEETAEEPPTTAVEGGDIKNHINSSITKIDYHRYILEHFNRKYCLLCEMHIAPNHLTAKRHTNKFGKTGKVPHKRAETFLRKWDEVAPEYQHMRNEFLPASPTLTFCLKCAVNVEFCMLEKHLKQFHGEAFYDLPEKLSLDFKSPTTRYSQKILDKYFKENIPQCNIIYESVSYPIFQNTMVGLCCLVCRLTVQEDIFTHLSSQTHQNYLIMTTKKRKQKVMRYHDYWTGLPTKYQEQLYYFNNSATSSFFCLLCGVGYGRKTMTLHFESPEHISNLLRENAKNSSFTFNDNKSSFVVDVPKESIEKKHDLFKGNDTQELLFPRKINDFVRKLHCLDVDIIQAPTKDKYFCFLCHTETNDVVKHTSLPQHELKLLDHSTNVEPVMVYHGEWQKIDPEYRRFQGTFFPVTSSIVFCKVCCLNVEYEQLNKHLRKCHDETTYVEFQDRLDVNFKFISEKEYSPKVQRSLYKDNIPQCNLILEGVSYPIIQTVDNHLRCLLCQKEISDDKYSHLSSINHALSAINLGMKKRLKMYHDTWLDGDEHFQMQQIYFEKDRDYYCKVCVLDVRMGDLREHIISTLHTTSLQKFLINERNLDKKNVFHDIEILPQSETSEINVESLQASQLNEYFNSDSDSEEGSDDTPKQYSKSVITEFYPDFDKYNCSVDGIFYPIFRTTVIGTVCMLCKRNPKVESIDEHIGRDSHKLKLTDETRHNKLRNFHKAWMKQEPAVQSHQKYFHRMQCLPCVIQVDYDSIADHVLNAKHERKVKLPFNATAKDRHDDEDLLGAASGTSTPVKAKKVNNEGRASPTVTLNKSEKANQSPKLENDKKGRHNIRKSIQNPNSQNIADRIPLRYNKDAKFLIVEKNIIFCGVCSKKLKNDMRGVKEHLDSADHLNKTNISRKKIKYSCDICNKYYSMEGSWDNHLVDLTHLARYNNLIKTRKGLTEYECLTCSLVIFGDENSVQKHRALFANRKAKETVLPKLVLHLLSSRNFIQENSEKLLKEARKAFNNQDAEKQVCVALVKVLKEYYPQCKAYPFGSRLTGLGYCDSDLDVFLDIGDMYNGNHHQDAEEQANIVNIVARTLQKHKTIFSDINKVAGARTPIVQVFHKDSNIDCDISFKHGLSVENTTFIKLCLDLQTILTPTLLYLKEWYASTNLCGLSSYALTMLMIFYLQTTGYLLSVKDLRLINADKGQIIDGWDTIKYTVSLRKMKEYVNNCDYTVIQLLENFFEYYAKFDFEKWVVCPLMGYLMSKSNFNGNGLNLPPEMATYVQKLRTSPNAEYFRNLTPMCVQDPFDLSHNLTKAFPRDMLKKFQAYCSLSKKHISALD